MIEAQVIRDCIKKNRKAEYLLYKQSFPLLIKICYRYTSNKDDAMDFLNRGFLKILTNLEKYDFGLPFEAWIRRIMVNVIIDEFRKNKQYKENVMMAEHQDLVGYHNKSYSVNDAEKKLVSEEVMKVVAELPPMAKEVLNLSVFDGYSHKEIGSMLGISEAASKWHLFNARNILKEKLSRITTKDKKKLNYEERERVG